MSLLLTACGPNFRKDGTAPIVDLRYYTCHPLPELPKPHYDAVAGKAVLKSKQIQEALATHRAALYACSKKLELLKPVK